MKIIDKAAAQGEVYIRRIADKAPAKFMAGGKSLALEKGRYVIGHSESGHCHVMAPGGVDVMEMPAPTAGIRLLRMIVANPDKELVHERGTDTHESIGLPPGAYEIRIGREYDPYAQLARQQAD